MINAILVVLLVLIGGVPSILLTLSVPGDVGMEDLPGKSDMGIAYISK